MTAALRRWARLPTVARIGAIYLVARLVTTGFFLLAASVAPASSRFGPDPSLGDFVLGWDAQWYWLVAVSGYPSELPVSDAGDVVENAWAFMPVYAFLAQGLGVALGAWGAGALVVSLVSGYLGCLALHWLLRPRIGGSAALWAVVFFASGPLAALFQVGYAESLFLLLLFLALGAVARRRFWIVYPLVVVMSYTRPGILAFALFLGLYGISRWLRRRREALPASDAVHIVALGALCTVLGFSWQVIAGIVTGQPDAYLATELAWRRAWGVGIDGFVPGEGWLRGAELWSRLWGLPPWAGIGLLAVMLAVVAGALLLAPAVRMAGVEVRLWSAAYLVYLLAVFFPQSSTFRLLLPLSPLWGAVAVPRSRGYRIGVLVLCLLAQFLWIHQMYALGSTYWQVP